MEKRITNIPTEPCRWSLMSACKEFEINRMTLQSRLSGAGIIVGEDGLYSTHDILAAVMGDIRAERLRKTREEADHVAIKNAEARKELIPATEVLRVLESTFTVIKQEILGSQLPEDTRRSILLHLSECEVPA